MRVWAKLTLQGRLLLITGLCLLTLGIINQNFSLQRSSAEYRADAKLAIAGLLQTLELELASQAVIGDYTAIQQILDSHAGLPYVQQLSWHSEHATMLKASVNPLPQHPPEWFQRLAGLQTSPQLRNIAVGGRSYGTVRLQIDHTYWENRLWQSTIQRAKLVLAELAAIFLLIALILRSSLRPLKNAVALTTRFAEGDYSVRTSDPGNSMPPDIRLLFDTLNHAAGRLETMLLSLTEQRGATDNAAIVSETDTRGDITYVNEKFCKASGYSREELLGANHRLLKSGIHPQSLFESMHEQLAKACVWRGEIANRRKDGSIYWLSMTITPVLDASGTPVRYVSISFDITALKEAEERIRRDFHLQQAMNSILSASLEHVSLDEEVERTLDAVASVPWIGQNASIGIYLLEDPSGGQLQLKSRRGPMYSGQCAVSSAGAEAICSRQPVRLPATYSGPQDNCPDCTIDGEMVISLPIDTGNTALGALTMCLPKGITLSDDDLEFLRGIAHTLARAIEHKRARHMMQWLGQIIEKLHDEIYVFDADSLRFLQVNLGARKNLGYSLEELQGMTPIDIKPLFTRKQFEALLAPLRDGTQPRQVFETIHRRKQGGNYPVEIRLEYSPLAPTPVFLAVVQDITQRRQREAALQESETKFEAMTGNVPGMVFQLTLAAEGILSFAYASEGAYSVCGVPAQELLANAEAFTRQIQPEDRDSFFRSMTVSVQTLSAWNWEGRIQPPQQDLKWVNWRCSPRLLANGDVLWDGVVFNITESKQSELEIIESREQLRALSAHLQTAREEEKAHIAREIHDELGSTLTALKMDAFWMAKRIPAELSNVREILDNMTKQVDGAVLATRRIVTELRPTILDDLGIAAAVEWQLGEFQKRMQIECILNKTAQDIVLEKARAISLFRIFQEALTNITRHAEASCVAVTLDIADNLLFFFIHDNGRGITPERIANPTSHGLRGMVERARHLGGKVHVFGAPGIGTTVTVIFPLSTCEEPA